MPNSLFDHGCSTAGHGLDPSAWLAAIVESSEDAIVSKTLDGVILSWNTAAEKLFGYSAQEAIGRSITIIIPEDRLHEEETIISRIRAGRRTEHFETVRQRKNGSFVDVSLTVSPVRDGAGTLLGASKVARDITASRRMAEQQQLLLHEMNHRVKNLFALANGLVSLCARGAASVEALSHSVQARLIALSQAHDMTLSIGLQPQAIALGDMIETLLKPYRGADGPKIGITAPEVSVGAQSLPSMALLLHELATNAAKYGALSSADGVLAVDLTIEADMLHLRWHESGLRFPDTPPIDKGFGSRLEAISVHNLQAVLTRTWRGDSLTIDLKLPVDPLLS